MGKLVQFSVLNFLLSLFSFPICSHFSRNVVMVCSNGPEQYQIKNGGKSFMNKNYPELDSFLTCETTRKQLMNGQILKEEVKEELEVTPAEIPMTGKKALRQKAKRLAESAKHGIQTKRAEGTLNGTIFTGTSIIIILIGIIYVCKGRSKKPAGKSS